jgi:hypothetical protein
MRVTNDPLIFSGESNPYKYQSEKAKGGKSDVSEILKMLAGMGEDDDEENLKSFLGRPQNGKASAPAYDPNKYYGGLYSIYGGRKVRGGLLGD